MTFKKALWLSIFIYTEDELELRKLVELPENSGLTTVESRPFWSIDTAYSDITKPEYTVFYSGGDTFTTPLQLRDFAELVDEHIEKNNYKNV